MANETVLFPEQLKEIEDRAIALAKDKDILGRFIKEFSKKIVGEEDTIKAVFLHMLCAYLKNKKSLPNVFINSESSAGKSYIAKAIVTMFPESRYEYRTKITPEAFTYWHNSKKEPEWTWDGKILYLEDVKDDLLNSPTFKVMMSEGSKATVIREQNPVDITINGKPIIVLTTASSSPNAEIVNRFSMVSLDESKEQTERVIKRQIDGSLKREHGEYSIEFRYLLEHLMHQQDVIFPEWIVNVARFVSGDVLRLRRDIPRMLDLMAASAALHQWQRPGDHVHGLIEAAPEDYELARQVLAKIDKSGGIYGLTHKEKKAWELCIECERALGRKFSAKQIFKISPFVSERGWHRYLEKFASRGMLNLDWEEQPGISKKPVTVFGSKIISNFLLPSYEDLINNNNNNNIIIQDTKDTNDSKERETEMTGLYDKTMDTPTFFQSASVRSVRYSLKKEKKNRDRIKRKREKLEKIRLSEQKKLTTIKEVMEDGI
jgi:hypothetical protein